MGGADRRLPLSNGMIYFVAMIAFVRSSLVEACHGRVFARLLSREKCVTPSEVTLGSSPLISNVSKLIFARCPRVALKTSKSAISYYKPHDVVKLLGSFI